MIRIAKSPGIAPRLLGLALRMPTLCLAAAVGAPSIAPQLTAPLAAQQLSPPGTSRVIGYPQNSTATWRGSHLPFGWLQNLTTPTAETEVRMQQLIPARYLPQAPTQITALTFQGQQSMTVHYPVLQVAMSPANRMDLDQAFGVNTPQRATVFSGTNVSLNWNPSLPTTIQFTTPYQHDGVSDLVLEIQKVAVMPSTGIGGLVQVAQDDVRSDLPEVRFAVGPPGSGAWQSPLGKRVLNQNLKFWLHFDQGVDVLQVSSAATHPLSPPFRLGATVELALVTDPGAVHAIWLGPGPTPTPFNLGSPILGDLWLDPGSTITLSMGPTTQHRMAITQTIPTQPNLVGLCFAAQAAVFNPTNGYLGTTNVVSAMLHP